MKKRLVAMLLTVTMLFNTNGVAMAAETTEGNAQAEQAAEQNTANTAIEISTEQNLKNFDNTLNNLSVYGTTCNSYLYKTDSGYQEVLIEDKVYILDFNKNGELLSEQTLDFELPVWGGFYSGENYNYLVYGQTASSEEAEIYRVVKYDKNFNRIKSLSVYYSECYTTVPFDAGNVSIAESGNHLIVYTSRERPDSHQSNIALRIDTSTMTIENKYGMISIPDIHVSHSFRQIIKFDGEQPIYVDLGDGSPRAVCLQQQAGIYTNMLDIEGQDGDNVTYTDVSGMAVTDTGYLVVGTQMVNYCNNIYLSYAEKGETTAKVIWLTDATFYNYSNVCNAKIIQITDGCYAVMWNCFDNGGSVNYVMVNDEGELLSGMKSVPGAELTQCEPIMDDGKVVWTKYVNGKRTEYTLNDFSCTGTYEWEDTYVTSQNTWDGTVDTDWYKESENVFRLSTPQQLAGFAQLVNNGNTFEGKKILLEEDMFFNEEGKTMKSWTPIAAISSGIAFEGTFDGQGHSLYNMYSISGEEGGLFGMIGEKGIVKAVRMSQGMMCGAAIAYQNKGWILFCENNSLVENIGDTDYTAGICCINNNLVYGCCNTGVIMGDNAAGVVGQNWGAGSTIDSCWNQGCVKGNGFAVAGIVSSSYGWVYDCYNGGTISGSINPNYAKTVAGIVGGYHGDWDGQIYNCYNSGYLDVYDEWNWCRSDTICGKGKEQCENVYSVASKYNSSTEVTVQELANSDTIINLQGNKIITKWCMDRDNLNNGCVIPMAQQDMKDGVYKILPDVWGAVKEVSITLVEEEYYLKAFSVAYYGMEMAEAIYNSNSSNLLITSDGIITPLKNGNAVVTVSFGGTEHTKETSYDVKVTIREETNKTEIPGTPDPTGTPIPTGTPDQTGTPEPTETPVPTGTPIPTFTPVPTSMPEPTQNSGTIQPSVDTDQTGTTEQPTTVTAPSTGTTLKDTTSNAAYKVTKSGTVANGTVTGAEVAYAKPVSRTASVTIPNAVTINGVQYKVTSIANNAFKNDKTLTKIKIGSNITTIGTNAFSGCKNLKSITIGKNVTTIKDKAFYNCVSVTKLTIPSKVKQIGKQAFNGCKKLKSVVIGKNVTNIGDKAFYKCTALTKIIIPSSVKKLGKQVFYGCKKLKTMTIKSSKLTSKNVGSNAFKGIYEKSTIKVPKKQLATYTKLLKAKGLPAKAVIKK